LAFKTQKRRSKRAQRRFKEADAYHTLMQGKEVVLTFNVLFNGAMG
jgi:hypothetical protein